MSSQHAAAPHRKPWEAPTLARHDSLVALTRQYVDPQTGQWLDPNDPEHMARLNGVPGSGTGFFP